MEVPGFWRFAEEHPDAIALVDADGRERRAGELFAAANRLAHGLRGLGVASGDAVAFLLPNGAPVLELLAAGLQSGLYLVPINTHGAAPEIAHILRDSEAKAFVSDASLSGVAARAADDAGLDRARRFAVGGIPGFQDYEALKDGRPAGRPEARSTGQFLQYTSGTTGRPKGVARAPIPVDPDLAWPAMAAHLARFGVTPYRDGVHLTTSPMYHTAPLVYTWFSLCFGHRAVLMDRFDPERTLGLIERHRVTTTHMVPTQFHRLLLLPETVRRRYDVSSLRTVLHAAAPCPVDTKRRMLEWWGPVIHEYYGATEGGGTLVGPEEWLARPGTVGRAWQGAAVRVLDDEGKDCPPRAPGTVYLKLSQDFRYRGDAEKTAASRIGEFFTVGDVGWLDEDRYLYLCDRKIDMIITGGVNVYPAEVEAALLAHPAVGDAAVFGIPDDDWGETVKAVVEPAPGAAAGPELAEALLAHCRERLAGYKCPRSIDFADALPRDPNGKLRKRVLRDPFWAGRERRI